MHEHEVTPLERLAAVAARAGAVEIESAARSLSERVGEGRFYLACVEQFKRGKSTVLDALLGDPILPIGVLPVTSLPTVVRFGPVRSARVLVRGSAWRYIEIPNLADYVSEQENPQNEKDVLAVEVFVPSPLLVTGMCLVDTPGIGSVFDANTAITHAFVPHIDAALVVLGADPPIFGDELSLSERIGRQVEHILFVLNKADRVSREELSAAKEFARRVLGNRLRRPVEIYELSAREQLVSANGGRDWAAFKAALERIASSSGRRLTWLAQQRGGARLITWLRNTITEEKRALVEPIQSSESRIRHMTEYIAQSEQALRDLGILFVGEQQRVFRLLEERREKFMAGTLPQARRELQERVSLIAPSQGAAYRRLATDSARRVAHNHVAPWLKEEEQVVAEEYARTTERFKRLANDFLERLATGEEAQLGHIAESIDECGNLSAPSQFQFHELLEIGRPASPLRYAADVILTGIGLSRVIRQEAEDYLVRLVDTNTSRVQSDLEQRLALARKELEMRVRTVLRKAEAAAKGSLARAHETKERGEAAIESRLAILTEVESELDGISRDMAEVTHAESS